SMHRIKRNETIRIEDVANFFFDLSDCFKVGRAVESVPAHLCSNSIKKWNNRIKPNLEQFDQVSRDVSAGNVQSLDQQRRADTLHKSEEFRQCSAREIFRPPRQG